MRRAIVALVGTAAGTVLLLGAKSGFGQSASSANVPLLIDGATGTPLPATGTPLPGTSSAAPSSAKPSSTQKAAPANVLRNGTFKGASIDVSYGNVQLSIVVAGGKITDVKVLDSPRTETRSVQISQQALPKLRQETLTAQSASINSVSGASYTSDGYRKSLQSAIDQARGA